MKKKKILSILVIGLIVLGMVAFVLTNYLHADCSGGLAGCTDWCLQNNNSLEGFKQCNSICIDRFYQCLQK